MQSLLEMFNIVPPGFKKQYLRRSKWSMKYNKKEQTIDPVLTRMMDLQNIIVSQESQTQMVKVL